MPRVVIIAGEASGDQLGAGLIRAARKKFPGVEFEGVAGDGMRSAGCRAWFDCDELAVMGLFEVLRHLPRLLRLRRQVIQRLLADPPDVLVAIDAPDFTLRIEQVARRNGIPTVHYVCPSVWAWRQGRVKILRKACDRVLCLLPFEVEFLGRHGVAGELDGHPLADQIIGSEDPTDARAALGVEGGPVIGLLPGSREGEVARLGPVFAEAAAWLAARVDGISFVSPAASPRLRTLFEAHLREFAPGCRARVFDAQAREVIAASDVVMVASGTATLETMLLGRPMVMAYRLAPLTYWVARLFRLVRVDHFSLPNLLAGKSLIPELIQRDARAVVIGTEVLGLLQAPERRHAQVAAFSALHDRLRCSASDRAAEAVLEVGGYAQKRS
jgi:lipid-A-disaccharide synthase